MQRSGCFESALRVVVLTALVGVWLAAGANTIGQSGNANPDALLVEEFKKNVSAYVKLHKEAAARLPALKLTASAGKLAENERALGQEIRGARPNAKQGEIFTPAVVAEFRRLIGITMHAPQGARIRASLKRGEPVSLRVTVNGSYPSKSPLQTMPPSLLLNLPNLPPEVEYRVVGHDLVLRDVTANLIVDFAPGVVP